MSGIRKTALDIRREEKAHALNGRLLRTGIRIIGGGGKGPYTMIVDRLNEKEVLRAIKAVADEMGWTFEEQQ